jgi:hypothetical protein
MIHCQGNDALAEIQKQIGEEEADARAWKAQAEAEAEAERNEMELQLAENFALERGEEEVRGMR